jgi:transcriptional regulator of acetoin/glycerol metabolism
MLDRCPPVGPVLSSIAVLRAAAAVLSGIAPRLAHEACTRIEQPQDNGGRTSKAATIETTRPRGKEEATMSASHRPLATAGSWTTPIVQAAEALPARAERIEQSHLRCAALGLTRVERPDFEPMVRGDLVLARERNQRLFTHAAPVMEMLFEQIVNTESMIVLTDAQGTILHSVGDDEFLARAGKVALSPGVNWAEQSKGTNAIGTALVEELPTLVHASEHFIHANSFLTCSAAPIIDPRGNMLGVLDVTGDQRSYHQHTMGLVRMSARMIENHWLSDDYGNRLRLHFHLRPEFIGTLLEGIIIVGGDGRILGGNRSALDQLDLSGAALRMHTLTSLFDTTIAAVFDHFRAPLSVPMRLTVPSGRHFHGSARFNGPMRSMMAGFEGRDDAGVERGGRDGDAAPMTVHRLLPDDAGGEATAPRVLARDDDAPAPRLSGLHYLSTGDAQVDTIVHKVQRVLNKDIPLLILGETGTGKELLARAVHTDSNRARQPFIAVNCASIPESLIEAELFGYEDGAFTGARRKGASGRIVQANGGTLFLDEIGDMPLSLQARLLRVLQERCVTPLGSHKSIAVDIAVVSATHRNLRDMIAAGLFREDLYYRLNGLVVRLPALRDRSDLRLVARRILLAEAPQSTPQIGAPVMALFERYAWPGNIRQLANVLRTAAVMASGEAEITEEHLSDDFLEDVHRQAPPMPVAQRAVAPPEGRGHGADARTSDGRSAVATDAAAAARAEEASDVSRAREAGDVSKASSPVPVTALGSAPIASKTLVESELALIQAALDASGGNISEASKRLGISRNTIYRKLRWAK